MAEFATKKEADEIRQAIRELYSLEARFKPASFERSPMPALEKILAGDGDDAP